MKKYIRKSILITFLLIFSNCSHLTKSTSVNSNFRNPASNDYTFEDGINEFNESYDKLYPLHDGRIIALKIENGKNMLFLLDKEVFEKGAKYLFDLDFVPKQIISLKKDIIMTFNYNRKYEDLGPDKTRYTHTEEFNAYNLNEKGKVLDQKKYVGNNEANKKDFLITSLEFSKFELQQDNFYFVDGQYFITARDYWKGINPNCKINHCLIEFNEETNKINFVVFDNSKFFELLPKYSNFNRYNPIFFDGKEALFLTTDGIAYSFFKEGNEFVLNNNFKPIVLNNGDQYTRVEFGKLKNNKTLFSLIKNNNDSLRSYKIFDNKSKKLVEINKNYLGTRYPGLIGDNNLISYNEAAYPKYIFSIELFPIGFYEQKVVTEIPSLNSSCKETKNSFADKLVLPNDMILIQSKCKSESKKDHIYELNVNTKKFVLNHSFNLPDEASFLTLFENDGILFVKPDQSDRRKSKIILLKAKAKPVSDYQI